MVIILRTACVLAFAVPCCWSSIPVRRRRILRGVLTALVALTFLILLSCAIPVRVRTGELAAPPLPVVYGGPPVDMSRRVWVDTDAACGYALFADADDCFALLVLLRAAEIEVVGISVVDGNAPAAAVERIARDLIAQLAHSPAQPIYRGLAARMALQSALAEAPLTIVALGPLTNIAAGLRGRPDLMRNVARLVAVMGRRPGHLFHPAEGRGNGILFGHGPVFRDFNFDKDRAAASEIVAMNLPITLIPYEGARSVRLAAADLARLETAGGAAAWVAQRARGWLKFWANVVGLDGFYPFDALAAAYTIEPKLFGCANVAIWVAKDGRRWGGRFGPVGLLVGLESERVEQPQASGSAYYCPRMSLVMHGWLMARLIDR
ncbi:nucleoside hydrolase [Piscinibacter sp.]|uniref:nucleoside hydrolase n=1 Tax=Piscinibacter sp. TaxID=1903157 RepID=UPI002C95BAF5|nr:nucleoside hydrolase [Albitalea sp.]HUG21543.1 nucleoside hydrolase [Albitalea sp.]